MPGMNKLPRDKRVQIISLLTEGMSLRAVSRVADVSINTVTKLLITAGQVCSDYQDRTFRNLPCRRLQIDEIWAFSYCKQANVKSAKAAPDDAGDLWTWVAMDADFKLVPSWLVAGRDHEAAKVFVKDLAGRLAKRVQITSDGHRPYLTAMGEAFHGDVDYAMLIKHYDAPKPEVQASRRYSPSPCVGIEEEIVTGCPDPAHISTSFVERGNLTMRMHMRRFTRLTNAFTKKAENHAHAVALHFMAYNFVRIHKTLKCSPAMAAGVTNRLWEVVDIVRLIEVREAQNHLSSTRLAAE